MTAEQYRRWTASLRARPQALRAVLALNKGLRWLFYAAYAALLVWLGVSAKWYLLLVDILVPGCSFVLVSVLRRVINEPRPYESLEINPLIAKETHGRSLPSRHVFSCFVIATCWFAASVPIACLLLALGVVVAVIRVLGGVHYPHDVIAGASIGLICGIFTLLL